MGSKYLIHSQDFFNKDVEIVQFPFLNITEFFYNSIQGEGISAGVPATFLRLSGCALDCKWCDTDWRLGRKYSFEELFILMKEFNLMSKFKDGQHLILTGGSPLKQQNNLAKFLDLFNDGEFPLIEVENECVITPEDDFIDYIYQWNNSPKLSNSGMKRSVRYKPDVIRYMSGLPNSWFKFVIDCEEDYQEILMDFLDPGLIKKEQVIFMPLGANINELNKNSEFVALLAIRHGVRFSTRMQLILNTL